MKYFGMRFSVLSFFKKTVSALDKFLSHKMTSDAGRNSPPRYPPVRSELVEEWDSVQNQLRKQIILCDTEEWQLSPDLSGLNRVAGVDISTQSKDHNSYECDAYAAVVICQFPSMKVIHEEVQKIHINVPYVPGYLAFRECQPAIDLLQKIISEHPDKTPDVLCVDGNGTLHPHRCGLACHIGVKTSIPTIGIAKNLHLVSGITVTKQDLQGMPSFGDHKLINGESNEVIGMALKTAKDTKNPMYISIGHKISLDTAKRVVLKCCKYRIPEPIRHADQISRELVRQMEEKSQSEETHS